MGSSRFLLLAFAARGAVALSAIANRVQLDSYVASHGARCLDGSPYELWHAPATSAINATKWVIDIQGGAWCQSISACAARAYTPGGCYLGSSNASCFNGDGERCMNRSDAMSFECIPACNGARWCGGLFVNDSSTNPLTHDWHQVLLPYHDGQSFTGNNETVTMTEFGGRTVPLYFRGERNWLASIAYLVNEAGMGAATEVALTGNSAGGLATYYHANALAALLPGVRVWAAPDSGFFFADDVSYPEWQNGLRDMVAMANSTLDSACVAAETRDPVTCAFPEVVVQHITTPLFVMQGRYDPALTSISCGESGHNASHVNAIGDHLLHLIEERVMVNRAHSAFVTACAEHCGQWSQGVDNDFNVTMGKGMTAIPALIEWRSGAHPLWIQDDGAGYPCPSCCHGGPTPPANASLVLLKDAAAADGAVCLDGSPAGVYVDLGEESTKWIIYQQGGGWCSSLESCVERANTSIGSSTLFPPFNDMREVDYLSNDPFINPLMANWTHVYLPYGDGSSQTSDLDAPVVVGSAPHNVTLFFRGARVRLAQQEYLRSIGLGDATEIVIAGCSAGGLSVYQHVDKWAAAFPAARVTGLADSGFFMNYDYTTGKPGSGGPDSPTFPSNLSYSWRMWWMADAMNVTGSLNARCLAAQPPDSAWLCLFAESVAPFLTTPVFALQSYHDSYQIAAILHSTDEGAVNTYGQLLDATVKRTLLASAVPHGAALDACAHHCGGSGEVWPALPFGPKNITQNAAWAAWWGGGVRVWEQKADYPCKWCCGTRETVTPVSHSMVVAALLA